MLQDTEGQLTVSELRNAVRDADELGIEAYDRAELEVTVLDIEAAFESNSSIESVTYRDSHGARWEVTR
jgi:hypothetical protein